MVDVVQNPDVNPKQLDIRREWAELDWHIAHHGEEILLRKMVLRLSVLLDETLAAQDVLEDVYNPSAQLVQVAPAFRGVFVCTNVLAALPAGATGLLTIGEVNIPVSQGTTSIETRIPLKYGDTRALQSTVLGPMALVLTGKLASSTRASR